MIESGKLQDYRHREADERRFKTGPNAEVGPTLVDRTFRSLYDRPDYRRARAMTLVDGDDAWLNLKTTLNRGEFSEARLWLQKIRDSRPLAPDAIGEAILEEARLQCYEGNWTAAEARVTEALVGKVSGHCRMTLLQIRSVARFEQAKFSEALSDLDTFETLASLYPAAPTRLYVEILRLRILARILSPKRARADLDGIWRRLKNGDAWNWDDLLVLARAEIDLRRIVGTDVRKWVQVASLAAERLGDVLYAHLAHFDHWVAHYGLKNGSARIREALAPTGSLDFLRIQRMLAELEEGASETTESMRTLKTAHREPGPEACELPIGPRFLVLPESRLIFTLDPFARAPEIPQPQVWLAIEVLRSGPLEKSDFFKRVWRKRNFSAHLHDANVRNLLHRVRRYTGLEVIQRDGRIEWVNGWVV